MSAHYKLLRMCLLMHQHFTTFGLVRKKEGDIQTLVKNVISIIKKSTLTFGLIRT